MLIDDNLISIDCASLASTITGAPIALTSLLKPGRNTPIPCCVMVNEPAVGGTSIAIKLQQAATKDGVYSDVAGGSVTVALANMTPGKNIWLRFLPASVTNQWIKFVVTPTGSFTGGTVSAFVAREDEFLTESGMYIDGGVKA